MTLIQYGALTLLSIPLLVLFDLLWLGVVARDFYQTHLGYLLGEVNWTAASVFYVVYTIGVLVFAVVPALGAGSLVRALTLGALFGFFAYATYDLTNYATVKGWPLRVVIVDVLWGTIMTGTIATLSYLIGKHVVL